MTNINQRPIGQLKSKVTVYCETCGCSSKRNLKEFVYENTPKNIKEAKDKLKVKSEKKYSCRICKSIKKDLS